MVDDTHFVTLGLGEETFAVPVRCVIEILAMRPLCRVPDAPAFLAGLTDVREQAVPVIDLRRKLALPPAEITEHTRIIVLNVAAGDQTLVLGLIADRVIEVIILDRDQIGPAPQIGSSWGTGYIGGIARHGGGFVIIFDMNRLFSGEEVAHISADLTAALPEIRAA